MPTADAGVKLKGYLFHGTAIPHSGLRRSLHSLTLSTSMPYRLLFVQVRATFLGRGGVGGVGIGDGATVSCRTEASQAGAVSGEIAAVPRAALTDAPRRRSSRSRVETTTEAMS